VVGWLLGVAEFSGTWGLIGVMLVTFFLLGCFIDWLPIMFITFPVFIPVATQVGIDLLYLVVLLSTLCQTCFLTPPFGYALFYLKGVLPLEITTSHVYRGVIPFILRVVSYCHPADSGIPRLAGCKVRSPVRDDGAKCAICRNEGDSTCFEGAAYAGSGVGDAAIHVL